VKPAATITRFHPSLILLLIAAFLAPLLGGQVPGPSDAGRVSGGIGTALLEVLGSISPTPTASSSSNAPLLAHWIICVLVGAAFIGLMLDRRVVQVPNNTVWLGFVLFFGLLTVSSLFSSYKTISLTAASEWLFYGLAFFAVIGTAGRKEGPAAVMTALFAGCSVAALKAVLEYGVNKADNPTWRVFGGWVNPNALAVMLLIGFFVGIGLLLTTERVVSLVVGIGTVMIGLALLLTQSKGALLVLVLVLLAMSVVLLVVSDSAGRKRTVQRTGGVFAMIVLIALALQFSQRAATSKAGTALNHLTNVSETVDQSAGFRKLLWRSSIDLIKHNPTGYGIGTFRNESTRPGLATQTMFAHNIYLQLATEGSPILCLLLLGSIGLWIRFLFRNLRSLPPTSRTLVVSIAAAVFALLAHGLIDSDLYYFGAGLSTFLLFGLGMLLSSDSVAPEFLFPVIRRTSAAFAGLLVLCLGYFAYVEVLRNSVRSDMEGGKAQEALATLGTLHSIAPADGDAWYLTTRLATDAAQGLAAAQNAVANAPSARDYRTLAHFQLEQGEIGQATTSFQKALLVDPNNLETVLQLAQLQRRNGDPDAYQATLRRLIAIEDTPYFQIKSLPELVPTETYQARVELANQIEDVNEKRKLLKAAVDGYRQYLKKTLPTVLKMAKLNPPIPYGPESMASAQAKMKDAAEAAQFLSKLDSTAGDTVGALEADKDAADFLGAIK